MDTNESQNNDNQIELTDLEAPDAAEVKGGDSRSGAGFYGTGVYRSLDGGKTWV